VGYAFGYDPRHGVVYGPLLSSSHVSGLSIVSVR
jgi:hypothetical protein